MRLSRQAGWIGVAALLVMLVAAPSLAKTLEPMVWGWERIFKLDYQPTEKRGKPVVEGYLINDSPYTVTRVQLLVESLDGGEGVLGQKLEWVPGDLTPFSRRYFQAAAPGSAPKYRVRVFAFDRLEFPGRDR